MSDTYTEEMFEFFTSKENFELVSSIYEQFEGVKSKLLTDFWQLVIEKLELIAMDSIWTVESYDEGIDLKDSAVWLYKNNHFNVADETAIVWVSFENISSRVYAHLQRDSDYIEPGNDFLIKCLSEIKGYDKPRGAIKQELCYIYTDDDFSHSKALKKILPYNRELLADSYANLLFTMANDLEGVMDKLAAQSK